MKPDSALGLYANFQRTARAHPQRRAFTFLDAHLQESAYTYEKLFAAVGVIAGGLAARRPDPELPLAILVGSQEHQVLHYLAAMSLGLTPAILTPPHRKLNREYYLETTRAIFRYARFSATITDVAELNADVLLLEPGSCAVLQQPCLRDRHPEHVTTRGSAFLQFSSGTTGIKRGVAVTDAAAVAQILAYSDAIGLNERDSIVSWLPLYHDMGFMTSLNMALACGVHSIMLHPIDWVTNPSLYVRAVSRYGGTLSWHPNFAFAFMADRVTEVERLSLSSIRGLVNCSEPATKQSQDRFHRRFAAHGLGPAVYWGCYAMAETTFALTHGECSDPEYYDRIGAERFAPRRADEPFVSVGRAIAGVDLAVTNEQGTPLPDRAVGELCVKSPFNFSGYYSNPAATAAAFRAGWYKTGDLGYRAGREFVVCGRKKDLLIIGGVNIVPQDLEDAVSKVAGIQPGRVSAFSVFDVSTQTERATILAETTTVEREHSGITLKIRQRVAAEFQITAIDVFLVPSGWLVKSSAGKMARGANREKWQGFPIAQCASK